MKHIIILAMCCLMLSGCVFDITIPTEAPPAPPPTEAPPESTGALTQTEAAPPETEIPTEPETSPPTESTPARALFIVYWGNDNADGFECAEVETDILDSTVLINELIQRGTLTEETKLNSMESEDGTLYLDFNGAFRDQVCSMGTSGEMMIIGSVVNTFLSAYGADYAMITVEGGTLESGHVIYDFPLEFFE